MLAVEYKGEPYKTNDDSREKKVVPAPSRAGIEVARAVVHAGANATGRVSKRSASVGIWRGLFMGRQRAPDGW